jgi:RecG-like helicase
VHYSAKLGIHKYGNLLNLYPNRYIDRTRYYKINEIQNNVAEVQIIGKKINIKTVEFGKVENVLSLHLLMIQDKWNSFGFKVINGFENL